MSMRPAVLIPILGVLALLPAAPALAGCGGCSSAAVLYAQPHVAPVLYAQPQPTALYAWPQSYGYASCGGCSTASYGVDVIHTQPHMVKQPIYVVNQGPHYSGAGIMVPTRTWSKGGHTGHYPYVAQQAWYDGGPYSDPMGHRYARPYGYHEQEPGGYVDAPHGPRIITRTHHRYGHAPRYAPRYMPAYSPRYHAPRYRPLSVRASAQRGDLNRSDVRIHRATPAKRRYQGY